MPDIVLYNGVAITPAPRVRIVKTVIEAGDGRYLSSTIGATVTGFLTARKDGYTDVVLNDDEVLSHLLAKQEALRALFSQSGKLFEITGFDADPTSVSFKANVKSITFAEDYWTQTSEYTIELESLDFEGEGNNTSPVESVSETWSFEDGETPHTYRVSHSLSATGRTIYEADGSLVTLAWERAKAYIIASLKAGWATTSSWSPKSGANIWAASQDYDSTAVTAYNRTLEESAGESDGTYNVTETFILSPHNYTEEINYSVKKVTEEILTTTIITVQGTIKGLYVNLHDYETRLVNAKTRWAALLPTLKSLALAQTPAGVVLNDKATQGNFDINTNDGSITFNYEFSDRILVGDTLETYTIDKKINMESPLITVTITGTILGILYPEDTDYTVKYARALARWNTVKALLYSRCLAEQVGLSPFPTEVSVTKDQIGGSVGYSYTFDNRPSATVIDDYTVSRKTNRADGKTSITVTGTIKGLYTTLTGGQPSFSSPDERINNAKTYWEGIKDNLFARAEEASLEFDTVNPLPMSEGEDVNKYQGTISYAYEYDNSPSPCISGALSEVITISKSRAIPVIAIQPIMERTAGPIIQDINTKTEKRLTVNLEVVMPYSYESGICDRSFQPPNTNAILDYAPDEDDYEKVRLQQDDDTWSPRNGRYNRTVGWIYV